MDTPKKMIERREREKKIFREGGRDKREGGREGERERDIEGKRGIERGKEREREGKRGIERDREG